MKKLYIYILISIFATNAIACNNTQNKNNTEVIKTATVSQFSEYGEDFEDIASQLKALIATENNVEFDCKNLENCIYFTIWRDGIALQAINAKNGDITSIDYWNKNLENYKQTSLELYDYALQLGLKSKPFRFAILNEKNKDNILAVFENNRLIYDYVNDK